MISTHTIKQPLTFQKRPFPLWVAGIPLVLSVLGHSLLGLESPQIIGLVTVGWGITSVLFFKILKKKKRPVKTLIDYDLHFNAETIVVGAHTYPIASLRNLRLNVGHYDGEPTVKKNGARVALEGIKMFADGPGNNPEFYDGSDSQLSFLAGGTPISLSFYIGSEAQRDQFNTLLKIWYTAGIDVQEFSHGLRTYLMKQLNYAEIQAFKERFGLKEQRPQKAGAGVPKSLPAD